MLEGRKISVVVPAAGSGKRMGLALSKQFLEIQGKPVIVRTLSRFQSAGFVDEIIVVAAIENRSFIGQMIKAESLSKVVNIVEGGAERQDSVWNGLQKVTGDIVLVHDAVRPFVDQSNILEVASAALESGAAILAVRAKETIKLSDGGDFILSTPDRKNIWIAQTPQAFSKSILMEAFKQARTAQFYGTDESVLVERLGVKVRIVEGNYDNLKITTPGDIDTAKGIIAKMSQNK